VVSAAANNELKALTLGVMEPNVIYMVNQLVAKARAASPGRKTRGEEHQRGVDEAAAAFAGTSALLSVRDVHTQLLATGINVSTTTVRSYMRELVAGGTLQEIETARGIRYRRL